MIKNNLLEVVVCISIDFISWGDLEGFTKCQGIALVLIVHDGLLNSYNSPIVKEFLGLGIKRRVHKPEGWIATYIYSLWCRVN